MAYEDGSNGIPAGSWYSVYLKELKAQWMGPLELTLQKLLFQPPYHNQCHFSFLKESVQAL